MKEFALKATLHFQDTYAVPYTTIFMETKNRIDNVIAKNKNISEYVNRTEFWHYYGIYMGICQRIFNQSVCVSNSTTGKSNYWLNF